MQGDRHQIAADHTGGDFGKALYGAFRQVFLVGRHYFQASSSNKDRQNTTPTVQALMYRRGANKTTALATVIRITAKARAPDPRPRWAIHRQNATTNINEPMALLAWT